MAKSKKTSPGVVSFTVKKVPNFKKQNYNFSFKQIFHAVVILALVFSSVGVFLSAPQQAQAVASSNLAPVAIGNFNNWTLVGGSGKVSSLTDTPNPPSNDGDTSIITATSTVAQTFNMTNAGVPADAVINSVVLSAWSKKATGNNSFSNPIYAFRIENGSTFSDFATATLFTDLTYKPVTATSTTNPFTHAPWTVAEVTNWGTTNFGFVFTNPSPTTRIPQITQFYVTVNYTIPPATLTLVKNVVNSHGGTATPANFTLTINGNTVTSAVANGFNAGTYTINESGGPSGYVFQSITGTGCPANLGGTVTLHPGDNVTCTITNADVQPKITINKTVVNDSGTGTSTASNFNLFVGSTSVQNGAQAGINAGSYTVSETGPAGYTASFSGACDLSGMVTLNIGDVAVCNIVNDDNLPPPPTQGSVTVTKVVINDNGGNKAVSDFPLFVDQTSVTSGQANSFDPGTYTISETGSTGYSGSIGGDCDSSGKLTVVAGQSYNCIITNDDKAGTLIVNKVIQGNQAASPSDFSFSVNGGSATAFNVNGENDLIVNAGQYTVTEATTTNYTIAYNNCGQVDVANGQTQTCTITNTFVPPAPAETDLAVAKTVNGVATASANAGDNVTFTVTAENNGPDTATAVVVNDLLDSHFTFVSATTTQGSYDEVQGKWFLGTMTPGYTVTLTLVAKVNAGTEGTTIPNQASVVGDQNDSNSSNNSASASVNVNSGNGGCGENCGGPSMFTFTLTKSGDGNGTVDGVVDNASSTTLCALDQCNPDVQGQSAFTHSYASGTVVTLTANPDSSSNFNGTWSGACSGTAPCTLTITANTTVNAHFAANPTTPPGGGGGGGGGCVNCGTGSGGGGIPVVVTPIGQVLGTSTGSSLPVPQVLGESTTLPRTGMPVSFVLLSLVALAAVLDRKLKFI